MSEDNETTGETDLEGVLDDNIRKQVRAGEKAQRELREMQLKMDAQAKDLAMTKAGVPESGPGKYFRQAWDGDLDPEAIKAAATADGIFGQQTPEPTPTTDAELHALRQAQATAGGDAPQPNTTGAFWENVRSRAATLPWGTMPEEAGREFVSMLRDAPPEMGIQWGIEQ